MDTALEGWTVFLTGASGGIGRAVAEAFAEEGARLALQGRRQFGALQELVSSRPWADRAMCLDADVTKPDELEGAMREVEKRWGRVDACVANAGIWPPEDRPLHELSESRVREVLEINLLGATWTARSFLRSLQRRGARADGQGSALVFTGSTAGQFGERGHADYAMSKAGLYGLVRTLKNEIPRIDRFGRVNMVEPGWTVTAMARPALEDDGAVQRAARTMSLRQLARAEDIARTVVYLSSPTLARHLTGQVITVAGGMEGRMLWGSEEVDADEVRSRARG